MAAVARRKTCSGVVFAILAMLGLTVWHSTAAKASERLTAAEVRDTFVGREWTQGEGVFLFSKDGTYRYDDSRLSARGSWQIAENGVLCTLNASSAVRTCYTFYRDGDGYRYWHDRSRRFWPARLR